MHNFIKHNFFHYKRKHIFALTQEKLLILDDSDYEPHSENHKKIKLSFIFYSHKPLTKLS